MIELNWVVQCDYKEHKLYKVYKRICNFMLNVVMPGKNDPKLQGELANKDGYPRDVSESGHWGTGNLKVTLRAADDWGKAKELIDQSYQAS